jgi:plastocyanin
MNLFSSGSIAPGKNFVTTFPTAGSFAYQSTVGADNMHGTIKVAPTAVFQSGTGNIVVTVGTSIPAGVTVDVQVTDPNGVVTTPGNNVNTTTFTFSPSSGNGVYKFKVRTNKNGASSDWSPTARATVS